MHLFGLSLFTLGINVAFGPTYCVTKLCMSVTDQFHNFHDKLLKRNGWKHAIAVHFP